jgi:carboxypeptidase A4
MKLLRALASLAPVLSFLQVYALPTYESAPPSYEGTQVLRIPMTSEATVAKLHSIMSSLELETWSTRIVANRTADILVPKTKAGAFKLEFPDFTVLHEDLGADIRLEREGLVSGNASFAPAAVDPTWFTAYHSYADHITWISSLNAQFASRSEIITAGKSVEGRTITGIHIFGSAGKSTKPAIVFHGNVHAREWITSKVAEYIAYQLLNNYSNSTDIKAIVDNYDFYIFPLVNPDGFSFTQTSTRLWRKNRSPPPSGSNCYGTDMNRNWPAQWGQSNGASTSPCDEDYKGTAASSTPEIKNLITYSKNLASTTGIRLFLDWHSYGQLFLYPWGYTCSTNPNSTHYRTLGNAFATALRAVRGTSYTVEQSCQLYITSGTSNDYHLSAFGTTDAFAVELPSNSFVLPASSITPVVTETWAGLLAMLKLL